MADLPTKSINLAIVIALCAPVWPHTPDLCNWTYHNTCLFTPEDTEEGHAYQVQCGDQNLKSVPKTTCDITVSLFNLSFNDLETLEEDALFKYKPVKYLYLQHCEISDINEKAFLDLENLTVVDLSNNYLTSFSPDLFKGNNLLQKLILRRNKFSALQWNTPLLNGPAALSVLDVHSCKLSHISLVTFSLIPNLTVLDISNNDLAVLDLNILSSHRQLEDVNLENNPWKCGTEFNELVCWMHNKLAVFHSRTVSCQNQKGKWETWPTKTWSSLCGPISNPSHERDTITSTKLNQSVTPSNKSDISTNSTLILSTPSENDGASSSALQWFHKLLFTALVLVVIVFVFLVWLKRKKSHEENEHEGSLLLH